MSDIAINVHFSKDSARRRPPRGNQERKKKWFHKKSRDVQQKGFLRPSGQDPPPHQKGPSFTNNRSSACPASASHCSQKPSSSADGLPSLTVAVNIREKPKEPVSKQPTSSGQRASASGSRKATATQTSAGLPTKYVAIDCEMVGTGPKGSISQLARCSLVSYDGDVLYDKFICPSMPVTDYRTRWSGIRRSDLANATPYSEARREILRLLMGKVVIGHAVHNDFKVLGYSHPSALTRDTSRIPLLNLKAGFGVNECASLKRLTKAIFNRDIQTGSKGHSSVEDARATMELYKVVEEEWERKLACRWKAS